jgi:type I restriction enzyme S subunit
MHWIRRPLLEVCDAYQPKTITAKEMTPDGEYPVFGANGKIGRYHSYNHQEAELLIGCRGSCGAVNMSEPRSWITGNAMVIKPKNAELLVEFLRYFFLNPQVVEGVITGVAQPQITRKSLGDITISYPPAPEQRRIVAVLDAAFAGLEAMGANARKNLQNAWELVESFSRSVFPGATAWRAEKLNDVVAQDCTLSYGIVQPGDDFAGGLPVVRPTDLVARTIKLDGLKRINPALATSYQRTCLQGGDLLLCVRGSTGVVAIASNALAGANVTRGIVPIRFNRKKISADFGYHILRSADVQTQIRAKTYGAAIMQINIKDLRNVLVRFPELDEQANIAKRLDDAELELNRLAQIYTQKIAAIDELKQSILQRAFSGALPSEAAVAA